MAPKPYLENSMAKRYWIVILAGDGIGPEIVDATLEVLETLQDMSRRFSLLYVRSETNRTYRHRAVEGGAARVAREMKTILKSLAGDL